MGVRKRVTKPPARGDLPLLEEIEQGVEAAVRRLLKKKDLTVADLVKIRDVVREILAERPREVVVRWVDDWDEIEGKQAEDSTGESSS